MSVACSKIIWLRGLLVELNFYDDSTPFHTSAIQIMAIMSAQNILKRTLFEAYIITLPRIFTKLQHALRQVPPSSSTLPSK